MRWEDGWLAPCLCVAPPVAELQGGQARLAPVARSAAAASPGLMAEVELVVRRAMEPEPRERYPSASELKQQLWRILFDHDALVTGRHLSRLVEEVLG